MSEMTRTEELLFRASTCDRVALTAEECTQLVALCRLQHEALEFCAGTSYITDAHRVADEAIAAFNKFEQGGE